MDKFIVMLSGGKDSLACYLKLVEEHGKENVMPISLSYFYKGNRDRDITIRNHMLKLTSSMNVTVIEGNGKDFSDILDGLFSRIDATQYYLCTGEIDHYGEIALYYEIINKYKLRGLYNPFIGKPKQVIFRVLEKYNVEFVTISAFLNKNNVQLYNRVFDYIGKRFTVAELENLYNQDPELYFALQSITLKCNGTFPFSENDINAVVETINTHKTLEKSVYLM